MEFIVALVGTACVFGVAGAIIVLVISGIAVSCRRLYRWCRKKYHQYAAARSHRQFEAYRRQRIGYGYRNERRP